MVEELKVSTKELTELNPEEKERFLESKSNEILQKINSLSKKIKESKEIVEKADKIKNSFFGKGKRKLDAIGKGLVATNEAVCEQNQFLISSIHFICQSYEVAQNMIGYLSQKIVEGFCTVDGKYVKLSEDAAEIANNIVYHANQYINDQNEVLNQQNSTKIDIDFIYDRLDKMDARFDKEKCRALEQEKNNKLSIILSFFALAVSMVSIFITLLVK